MTSYATPVFAVTSKTSDDSVAADLGTKHVDDEGRTWQLVKATAAVTDPEGSGLRWSDKSAYEVDGTAPGNRAQLAGIVSSDWSTSIDIANGDYLYVQVDGPAVVAKANTIVAIEGQEVWYDGSAGQATHSSVSGDFPLGVVTDDAAITATTVRVDLGASQSYQVDLRNGSWTTEATNGLGVTDLVGGTQQLAFDAVAEAAQAALFSDRTLAVAEAPVMEAEVAVFDIGDDAALDINFGLANGSHATDFDSVTEAAVIHLDGNTLQINVESDDGTTEVAAVDSAIADLVDDTYAFIQVDARDLADVKIYVNGVDAVPDGTTLVLSAATGPLKPIFHMEKTSNDTSAELRVRQARAYSTVAAA